MDEFYSVDDPVLSHLHLTDPCEIRIIVTEQNVSLRVGPRDWSWDRGCPDISSAGTEISPAPDGGGWI